MANPTGDRTSDDHLIDVTIRAIRVQLDGLPDHPEVPGILAELDEIARELEAPPAPLLTDRAIDYMEVKARELRAEAEERLNGHMAGATHETDEHQAVDPVEEEPDPRLRDPRRRAQLVAAMLAAKNLDPESLDADTASELLDWISGPKDLDNRIAAQVEDDHDQPGPQADDPMEDPTDYTPIEDEPADLDA